MDFLYVNVLQLCDALNICPVELPGCFRFAYVYHFFNVKWRISEKLTGLIWSTYFEVAPAWTKKKKKLKRFYIKLINVVFCWSKFNLNYHCLNEAKYGKTRAHEGYFFLKISMHWIFFSNKTHSTCKFLQCCTKRRIFCLSLMLVFYEKVHFLLEVCFLIFIYLLYLLFRGLFFAEILPK